jgi:hypothetical protein
MEKQEKGSGIVMDVLVLGSIILFSFLAIVCAALI